MSATGRGTEREPEDAYITPTWTVDRFVERYTLSIDKGAVVLDPCCAEGELLTELHKLRPDLILIGFELREECRPALEKLVGAGVLKGFAIGSFMDLAKSIGDHEVGFVISNPPYSLAQEFIETAERIAKVSIWLLRQNFLGATERAEFTDRTRPGLFTSPNRPSFTGWGGDATEYAWFVYGDNAYRGRWEPLALTPAAEIAAWNKAARARYPHLNPKILKAKKKAAALAAS